MKKKITLLVALVAVLFIGCKKDQKSSGTDLINTPYANKTVAETKTDVENNGVEAVDQMKSLNNETGMEATVNFMSLLVKKDNSNAPSVLKALNSYYSTKNVRTVLKAMRSTESDPLSIVDQFNKHVGIYKYNFVSGDFDSTYSPTNTIVFEFPASKTSKDDSVLDGTLTINSPTVKTGPFTYGDQTVNELPTSFSFDIKINDVTGLSYLFSASYDDQGVPSKITSTLDIGAFEFKAALNYSKSASDVDFSIKHDTKTIIDIGGGVNGNFDKTNIENAYHYEYDTMWYYDPYQQKEVYSIDTNKVTDPDKILTDANAHFQLMNIKVAGQVDFKDLYTNMKAIDDKESNQIITTADAVNQRADLINKDMVLIVVYADSNTKIAQAEAYEKEDQWTDYYGITQTDYSMDVRMIFADKSKNSLDTYFQEGFNGLIDEINSFLGDLNTKYGWNLNPVSAPSNSK